MMKAPCIALTCTCLQRCIAVIVLGMTFRDRAAMAAPIANDFDDADLDRRGSNSTLSSSEGEYGKAGLADHVFQPNHPLLLPGFIHEYRYRTRTLTAPHEGSSSTGIELTCIVHFEVDSGIDHDSIVTMTISKPHVFRLGTTFSTEDG